MKNNLSPRKETISREREKEFEDLYRLYSSRLVIFAYRILGNWQDAEDAVQECFVKLWDRPELMAGINAVKSYLYTSVRNSCINLIRKKATHSKRDGDKRIQIHVDDSDVERHMIFAETVQLVHQKIAQLPPRMQEVFKLYYLEGKSYQEIGAILDTEPETVRNQRGKALRQIRDSFEGLWALVFYYSSFNWLLK